MKKRTEKLATYRFEAGAARRSTVLATAVTSILMVARAQAVELPQPCVASCTTPNGTHPNFVSSGAATATVTANTLRVTQTTNQAILNWASFNVSADGHVIFDQPTATSIALNRIYQQDPSRIFGTIDANGQVYLLNPNGLLFGNGSRVNASGILASTLSISDDDFATGLLTPINQNRPALAADQPGRTYVTDANGQQVKDSNGNSIAMLTVEDGARLTAASGGRVMLAGQTVNNAGTIQAPDGQVVLASGEQVYLQASGDVALRGLIVEVDKGNTVWNQLTGNLSADRGNVTLVGMAVNQDGRISATSTVSANGSVYLLARNSTAFGGAHTPVSQAAGSVTLGAQSVTEVNVETNDPAKAPDEQDQLPSTIKIAGQSITFKGGAQLAAHGGQYVGKDGLLHSGSVLDVTAQTNPAGPLVSGDTAAHIAIESGVAIDLSGSDATLSMSSNVVAAELRSSELADSPAQRDSALRGQTVYVDARLSGTRSDGSTWEGTPLANASGQIGAVEHSVAERTTAGGTATFQSGGDIAFAQGANIDVSGGVTNYLGGYIATSMLITPDGRLVDIAKADPLAAYVGVYNPASRVVHDRWGVVEAVATPTLGHYEAGYVQGASAGTVQFAAPALAVNGTLIGRAVNGPYQRTAATLPLGGQLIIGVPGGISTSAPGLPNYLAPSVVFSTATPTSSTISNDAALVLPTDYLTRGGFTRTSINSNGSVTLQAEQPLDLAVGSLFTVAAKAVNVLSDIRALGGTIRFTAARADATPSYTSNQIGINIGDSVTLDVRGVFTNDSVLASDQRPLDPIWLNGGSIALVTTTDRDSNAIALGSNVQLRASGGAWIDRTGKYTGSRGGGLTLEATGPAAVLSVGDNIVLDAFGFVGASGGTFSLTAPRLSVGRDSQWASGQSFAPGLSDAFQIGAGLFSNYGFATINLTANGPRQASGSTDALNIAADTSIVARVDKLALPTTAYGSGSGDAAASLAARVAVPDFQQQAMSIAFGVVLSPNAGANQTQLGTLTMATGARLIATPRSSISLTDQGGSISIDGIIEAHGGAISAHLDGLPSFLANNNALIGYQPTLGLTLGQHAVLDVSGTVLRQPNDSQLLLGQTLNAGTLDIKAQRGFLSIERGAYLNAAGTTAPLDIPTSTGSASYARRVIGTNGGAISLQGAEALSFLGALDLHGGTAPGAQGGALAIEFNRARAWDNFPPYSSTYPTTPRVIELTGAAVAGTFTSSDQGTLPISTTFVQNSGAAALTLKAEDRVDLREGVNLSMARSVELEAPAIAIAGTSAVNITAPYVAIGNTVLGSASPASTSGPGQLNINADFIEVKGNAVTQNIGTLALSSSGDIRFRGNVSGNTSTGSLSVAGNINLSADRVYAGTITDFTVRALGSDRTIRISGRGEAVSTPLSVASALHIVADNIDQSGAVLAPFGTIELTAARSLRLGADSLTSVTADGTTIPYGQTVNGTDWIYNNVIGAPFGGIPSRSISISADAVEIASSATVDLRGGGDLYAYEFVPGTGGSVDALAPGKNPNLYAILPSLTDAYAPFDPQEYSGSNLTPGASVYLSGLPGFAAGTYALLPARYALLPGAYLVRAMPGYTDLRPGARATLSDGTPVVAGYSTFAGAAPGGGGRYDGFAVWSGGYARLLAEYDDHLASSFFADRAARLDMSRPNLPADAGALAVTAGTSLQALGLVRSQAAPGGIGASIDLSATRLEVVGAPSNGTTGVVQIGSDVLNAWQPASLLLGGRRSGDSLTVNADDITIAGDADLSLGEVTLVARNSISIAGGAQLSSEQSSAAPTDIRSVALTGAGATGAAFVSVSNAHQWLPTRSGIATVNGRVDIDTGAQVSSRGALVVDAPGGGSLLGSLHGDGARWSLGANTLVFGDDAGVDALGITTSLTAALNAADTIRLAGASSIDFHTAVTIGGGSNGGLSALELTAAQLRNDAVGNSIALSATDITVNGSTSSAAAGTGSGTITLAGNTITLQSGSAAVSGFDQTSLLANGQLIVRHNGAFSTTGELRVVAQRLTAGAGSNYTIGASNDVTIGSSNSAAGSLPALELGGGITITGRNITDSGRLTAPSGVATLSASGDLLLTEQAVVDVAGTSVTAADQVAFSSGGTIHLDAGGHVTANQGAQLNVAGAGERDAGRVTVTAIGTADMAATLSGAAAAGARGGQFQLTANRLSDFSALTTRLQQGGFTGRQSVAVNTGDLAVAAGVTMRAHDIELIANGGQVTVAGTIVAPADAERSSIRLYGAQGVTLAAGGNLSADSVTDDARGGFVEIGAGDAGAVSIAAQGAISAWGDHDSGGLLVRAAANQTTHDVAITQLAGDVSRAGTVTLEPVLVIGNAPAALTATEYNSYRTIVTNYAQSAQQTILSRLNIVSALPVSVQPGIEIRRSGDISLSALDMSTWRFNGEPAALTVRATGSISVNGTISDGVVTQSGAVTDLMTGNSATLRFIAGANLGAVDPLAVSHGAGSDLRIGAGAVVRTGTGNLRLAAARDIQFNGAGASVYTTGRQGFATQLNEFGGLMTYGTDGGQLSLSAGRDVVGRFVQQAVSEWQTRQLGKPAIEEEFVDAQLAGVAFDPSRFKWNSGTFGGGDLRVTAGRDIGNLSAATADSVVQPIFDGPLVGFDGGALSMNAGRDINTVMLFAAEQTATLHADGGFGSATSVGGNVLGTFATLGDAALSITARGNVNLESVSNPTLWASITSDPFAVFPTYGASAALDVTSAAGSITLNANAQRIGNFIDSTTLSRTQAFSGYFLMLPPTVGLSALTGDVVEPSSSGLMFLYPSDTGQLNLFAGRDIAGVQVRMSDTAPLYIPTLTNTLNILTTYEALTDARPAQYRGVRHLQDDIPVVVSAGRDILNFSPTLPKAALISSERDIVNLKLRGQNLRDTDLTLVHAGRDITYTSDNTSSFALLELGGPGRFELIGGRNVDLGTSAGIATVGNLVTPNLPTSQGADVTVLTGTGSDLEATKFLTLIDDDQGAQSRLIDFVASLAQPASNYAAARASFVALDADQQRPFLVTEFFHQLVESGREANLDKTIGFNRGYAAIDALFPDSRAGQSYLGNLNLVFSRIYTLAGGDINLIVPGGSLNVGVANPPPTVSNRPPSELGIVTQRSGNLNVYTLGDVLVNSSRVFTLLGGDIAIWSTLGNIDAGRGAKTAISAPPPAVRVDAAGNVRLDFSGAVAGSGIRTISTAEEVRPGDVDLIAPAGFVNAGDAGIGAGGNLNIAAARVIGLDNIQVGGSSAGVPAETSGIGAALPAPTSDSANTKKATDSAVESGANRENTAPLADTALSWLDVFVVGLGEDACKQDDIECLKRQK